MQPTPPAAGDLARAISDAAPIRDEQLAGPVLEGLLANLGHEIASTGGQPVGRWRRRHGFWRSGLLAIVASAALGGAIVMANNPSAYTGLFGSPKAGDASQFLDSGANDYGSAVSKLIPDIPLPPGLTWDAKVDAMVAQGSADGAYITEKEVPVQFAWYAYCGWEQSWLTAHAAGDTAAMSTAQAQLAAAPGWPEWAWTFDQSTSAFFRQIAGDARAGDAAAVAQAYNVNCDTALLGPAQ
jgi:hypothetical protein